MDIGGSYFLLVFSWFSAISIFINFFPAILFSAPDPAGAKFHTVLTSLSYCLTNWKFFCIFLNFASFWIKYFLFLELLDICMVLEILKNRFKVVYLICKYFKNLAYLSCSKLLKMWHSDIKCWALAILRLANIIENNSTVFVICDYGTTHKIL